MNKVTLALIQAFADTICTNVFFTSKERVVDHNNDIGTFTISTTGSPAYIIENLKKMGIKKCIICPKSTDARNKTSPMGCFIIGVTGVNNSESEKIPLIIKNKNNLQHIDTMLLKQESVDEYIFVIFFKKLKTFQTEHLSVRLTGLDKKASLVIEMKKFANAN
ncbi:MAG: hypothetical protein KBC98_02790 [Candidatus Pacebacteria bacterium]|nr:hypothetical protein [Candidatus Paceibacterota bacterium]